MPSASRKPVRRKQAAQAKLAAQPKQTAPEKPPPRPARRLPPRAIAALIVVAVAAIVGGVAAVLSHGGSTTAGSSACVSGALPMQAGHRGEQWSHPPPMQINASCSYTAAIDSSKGPIVVSLDAKAAPTAVNNFVFLARHHFYTNVLFHRVLKGFMIQTGDPKGTGTGGPGYHWKIESPGSSFIPGTVAMANTGQPNSNGSQFFICQGAECAASLDASAQNGGLGYTVFGRVISGMSVVNAIATAPVGGSAGSSPIRPIYMESVAISEVR
jgi:cyclophilin family peptidyl-prolyl cis-trans isomerase